MQTYTQVIDGKLFDATNALRWERRNNKLFLQQKFVRLEKFESFSQVYDLVREERWIDVPVVDPKVKQLDE